jgi:hypothetical protein
MRHGQYLRAAAFDDGVLPMQVYGENLNSSEDVGYEEGIPKFPLSPQGSGGYLLRMTGDERVALMHRTLFDKYVGVSHIASEQGDQISVRYEGVVFLPVGKLAIAAGDIVQATPQMLDGSAGDDAYDGDIIPAFVKDQVVVHVDSITADTPITLPGGIEMLKIVSATRTLLTDTGIATASLTVANDGFAAASATIGDNNITLYNASQGVYATQFSVGNASADAAVVVIEGWVKSSGRSLPEWYVGKALHAGSARVDATHFSLIPVQLRGF